MKITTPFLIFLLFGLSNIIYSQTPPDIDWQHCHGGSASETNFSSVPTTDGGFILVGDTYSNDFDVSGNHSTSSDAWVTKIDAIGNIEWQHCYGGIQNDELFSICATTDGNYILAGYSYLGNDDILVPYGQTDGWIIKIDDAGGLLWQKSYGGSNGDIFKSIKCLADGSLIVVGNTWSPDGDVTDYSGGEGDCWIIKLNSIGDILWNYCYGGSLTDEAGDILLTQDGGFLITGYTYSIDGDATGNNGSIDAWIFKIDNLGSIEWHNCVGGTGQDFAIYAIQKDLDTYLIIGTTSSNDGEVIGNHGAKDAWSFELNSMGIFQWQKCYGGTLDDHFGFILDDGANFIIEGNTESNDGDITVNQGGYDLWVVKTDYDGVIVWQKTYGGSNTETYSTIQSYPDGSFLLTGYTGSDDGDISGNHGEPTNDVWVVKLQPECPLVSFYADIDTDGFGDPDVLNFACTAPVGFVSDNTDCNDSNGLINPAMSEVCNDIDDNCNGSTDEGVLNVYFADIDGDGYGDIDSPIFSCLPPFGYVNNNDDCNDTSIDINPDAAETCNLIDDNCDGSIDEGVLLIFYADGDADGFGDATSFELACIEPTGFVTNNTDCNDADDAIYPGAIEICNNIDDDCDANIDDGLPFITYFIDQDEDGFGDALTSEITCDGPPFGYISDSTDCDDNNALVYPGATEFINGVDDDCNGIIDDITNITNSNSILVDFQIYPNPAQDFIYIDFPDDQIIKFQLLDNLGRVLKVFDFPQSPLSVDLQDIQNGVYFIKITNSDSTLLRCFLKN